LLLEHVPRLQFCVETSDAVNPSVFLVPAATVPKPDTGENIFCEAILCFLTGNRLAKIERLTMKITLKKHFLILIELYGRIIKSSEQISEQLSL